MKRILFAVLLIVALLACSVPTMAQDNVLHTYVDRVFRTFSQVFGSDGHLFIVLGSLSEGLLRLDENHNPQPALAESYTVSDDGLVYTFTLRDGITWSDGTPITAKDFEFAWLEAMCDQDKNGYADVIAPFIKNGWAWMNHEVEASEVGVKALDDKTFECTLENPTAFWNRLITLPCFFPLNEEFYRAQGGGDLYATSVDTMMYCGPFVATFMDLGVGVTMEKNPNYWDAENVKLDGVDIKVITDSSAALNAYEAGELDRVNLSSIDVVLFSGDPEFGSYSDFRNYFVQYDVANPKMNLNIRKAINYAIDRETLVNEILMTGAVAAGGVVSRGIHGNDEMTYRDYAGDFSYYDPELAKQYWDAGVAELGYVPELTMLTAEGTDFDDMATFLQDCFRKVLGVEVTINKMTQKARNEIMKYETYDFALNAWGADYDDAMTWLELWTNNSNGYRGNYGTPEYIAMIEDARSETDDAVRLDKLVAIEKKLIDEDCVVTGIYDRGYSYLQRPYVENYIVHPVGQSAEFKWTSLNK